MIRKLLHAMRAVVPIAFVLLALMTLGACQNTGAAGLLTGTVENGDTQDEVVALSSFVSADLQAALDDAVAHDDVIASTCYAKLLEKVDALPGRTAGKVVGAISGFQKARNLRRAVDGGISDEVSLACAALVNDAKGTVFRLARLFGVPIP